MLELDPAAAGSRVRLRPPGPSHLVGDGREHQQCPVGDRAEGRGEHLEEEEEENKEEEEDKEEEGEREEEVCAVLGSHSIQGLE